MITSIFDGNRREGHYCIAKTELRRQLCGVLDKCGNIICQIKYSLEKNVLFLFEWKKVIYNF